LKNPNREDTMSRRLSFATSTFAAATLALAMSGGHALAQKKYDTGATDTEIKIGNIVPYSGPASAYGVVGKAMGAVFHRVNDAGGINGRKINFISYDDAYSPPKAVEQVRKLVESDEVLLAFGVLGTPSNSAIQKYLNAKKVPQLFLATGATKWNDPKHFPWTMGWLPSYQAEGNIYAKYLLKDHPGKKIAILYQNDDFGKDYLKGIKDGLGDKASNIVIEESYELSEPTIDTHIVKMKAKNPDVMVYFTTPKFGAQALKKVGELAWKPVQIIANVSASTATVMKPAGFENAQGVISAAYAKDASDPQWKDDAGMKDFDSLLAKYLPDTNRVDSSAMTGYNMALTMVALLKNCGDDLTRANIMKQAANFKDLEIAGLLPGIKINTSPTDFAPISQLQLMRFDNGRWQLFGDVISSDAGK
jgi:ABC-type branched-subunit amino acid transport system substrate-binding protein